MGAKSARLRRTSSPPPYGEAANSRLIIAETTTTTTEVVTTTTTTTQTTTHFFPLSPWKRRENSSPSASPLPQGTPASSTSENGVACPAPMSTVLRVDKDLPPTPSDVSHSPRQDLNFIGSNTVGVNSTFDNEHHDFRTHLRPSLSRKPSMPFSTRWAPQAPQALVHPSLAVGLPRMVQTVPTSLPPDINTIAFVTSPLPPSPSPRSSLSHLRHTRCTQRPKVKSTYEASSLEVDREILENRRNRGLSLGTTLFNFGNSTKREGLQESGIPHSVSRSLSRKPSLWFRKKTSSSIATSSLPVSPVVANAEPLRLPEVHPVSPFDIDICLSSSDGSSEVRHVRALSRSHSERIQASRPATVTSGIVQDGSLVRHPSRHPSAYNYSHSPVLDDPSPPTSVSPPLRSPTRPRAQTNPPFLHRLSTNLFPLSLPSTNFTSAINSSPSVAFAASPKSSLSRIPPDIAKPQIGEESPEAYLNRLAAAVSKSEIATVLASRYVSTVRPRESMSHTVTPAAIPSMFMHCNHISKDSTSLTILWMWRLENC